MRRSLLVPATIAFACACGAQAAPPVVAVPPPVIVAVETPHDPEPLPVATPTTNTGTPSAGGSGLVEAALREWTATTLCQSFDYHPNGGIQSFWCHRPSRLGITSIREAAGVDLFASGPHPRGDVDLDATNEFGHYNPVFVRWLVDHAGPSPRESALRQATQSAYDAHLKPLAAIFHYTLEKAKKELDCFNAEKKTYSDLIAKKRLPKEIYQASSHNAKSSRN